MYKFVLLFVSMFSMVLGISTLERTQEMLRVISEGTFDFCSSDDQDSMNGCMQNTYVNEFATEVQDLSTKYPSVAALAQEMAGLVQEFQKLLPDFLVNSCEAQELITILNSIQTSNFDELMCEIAVRFACGQTACS